MSPSATSRAALRQSAWLLLAGQVLYVGVTQFHAGGDANDHHAIFATYAANPIWMHVHLGQFLAMAVMIAGAIGVFAALAPHAADGVSRLGHAAAIATLTLYGALQAVDGVALKHAVAAWAAAPEAEEGARFAAAEAVRWLEWGMRSYHDFALALTLFLLAAAIFRATALPVAIVALIGLTGAAYVVQGWIAGSEGFTPAQSMGIVAAWLLSAIWMAWLALGAGRAELRQS